MAALAQHDRRRPSRPRLDRLARRTLLIERRGLAVLTGYAEQNKDDILADHLFYDLAMTSISRLGYGLAKDLARHGVTAVTLSPGVTGTEAITAALGDDLPPGTDPVEFCGRAICALLQDPNVARHAGKTVPVADLASEYGFAGDDPRPPS